MALLRENQELWSATRVLGSFGLGKVKQAQTNKTNWVYSTGASAVSIPGVDTPVA